MEYLLITTRREALIRRSDKLIERLRRPENSTYGNEESVDNLLRLIRLIIWALEQSIETEHWQEFRGMFQGSRKYLTEIEEGKEPAEDDADEVHFLPADEIGDVAE